MTKNRKRKFEVLLVTISVLLVLTGAIAGILIWENRIENQFPRWEKLSDTDDRGFTANPDVELRFTGIDFDVEMANGRLSDRVLVDLKVNTPDAVGFGHKMAVDYLYNDEWYNVYYVDPGVDSAPSIRGNFHDIVDYYVPCGLFAKDGIYRMTIDGFGYCDIDIIGIEDKG